MSEEKETNEESGSEMCPICGEWCGKDNAASIAEWEADIIAKLKKLEELRAYKEEKEKHAEHLRKAYAIPEDQHISVDTSHVTISTEEKITGVCVDIPKLIKEAKGRKLFQEAVQAAQKSIPERYHWTSKQAQDNDLKREGYIKAYIELHDGK